MGARLHSWWLYIRKHRRVAIIIALIPTVLASAGNTSNLTIGRILLRFYTLVCYMRDASC